MIGEALPNSLSLGVLGFVVASAGLSCWVCWRHQADTWLDNRVKFLAILGQALPTFWTGIVLIYVFGV
jgi:peptide/nickel transport system permease protein